MAISRLDSDERRKAIVLAAVPLFARNGFAGTTTRELAAAAGGTNRFWFAHHVAAMMAFAFVPPDGFIPYEGGLDRLVAEAGDFALRGIGMTETAIAASRAVPLLQTAAD